MNYKRRTIFYLILALLSTKFVFAQKNIDELLKSSGFRSFCIQDTTTLTTKKDSIRFVISGNEQKPTIFFIQGSSTSPLFIENEGELYYGLVDVAPTDVYEDYNIVIISKPSVPIVTKQNYVLSEKEKEIFDNCNLKDYYISSLKQVYEYLRQNKLITESRNYLFGHSQGYGVVAKYATVYPNDFLKYICASSSIYNVPAIRVNQITKKFLQETTDQTEEKQRLNKIYSDYENMYEFSKDSSNKYYLYYKKDISFWEDLSIDYLLKISKPLLIVYGMNDADALDNRVLPILFINKRKTNLSIFAYPDYDHNFNTINNEFHWHDVFRDVKNWIEE